MNISKRSVEFLYYLLIYFFILNYSNAKEEINEQIIFLKKDQSNFLKNITSYPIKIKFDKTDIEYTESIRKVLKNELNKFVQYMESSIPNNYLYKPIYSRVKTIESMERKEIKRSKMAGKFIHWSEIYDQCGISIIISPIFKTSLIVEKLKQLEKNSSGDFKIMEIENKSDIFGYRAFHIDIEYRSQIRITKVEIQIRSVYEDIYNIISHEYYKENGIQNENNLKKRFHFQSFLLYTSELIQSTTKIKSE